MTGPERTCVGCRARRPAEELVRVVTDGTGLVVDVRRRMPGRGAWVHADPGCVELAVRRKAWSRALRVSGLLVDADDLATRLGLPQLRA